MNFPHIFIHPHGLNLPEIVQQDSHFKALDRISTRMKGAGPQTLTHHKGAQRI